MTEFDVYHSVELLVFWTQRGFCRATLYTWLARFGFFGVMFVLRHLYDRSLRYVRQIWVSFLHFFAITFFLEPWWILSVGLEHGPASNYKPLAFGPSSLVSRIGFFQRSQTRARGITVAIIVLVASDGWRVKLRLTNGERLRKFRPFRRYWRLLFYCEGCSFLSSKWFCQ